MTTTLDVPRTAPELSLVRVTAMSLLALLGLRYPVKMLPVLEFETVWKVLWLGVVAAWDSFAPTAGDRWRGAR